MTHNLLDHPEIVETKDQEENPTTVASTLNFGAGVANKVMVDILQNIDRENVRTQIRQNEQQGQQALETLLQCKKLSAGAAFKSGQAMLGTDVLQIAVQRKIQKDEAEKQKVVRQNNDRAKKRMVYDKATSQTSHLYQSLWSVSQLKALISFKKQKTDTWQQPKNKTQLIEKWKEIKDRATPLPSPAQEEQQDDEEEENAVLVEAAVEAV